MRPISKIIKTFKDTFSYVGEQNSSHSYFFQIGRRCSNIVSLALISKSKEKHILFLHYSTVLGHESNNNNTIFMTILLFHKIWKWALKLISARIHFHDVTRRNARSMPLNICYVSPFAFIIQTYLAQRLLNFKKVNVTERWMGARSSKCCGPDYTTTSTTSTVHSYCGSGERKVTVKCCSSAVHTSVWANKSAKGIRHGNRLNATSCRH